MPREPQHAAAFVNFIGGYLRVVSSCSVGSFTNIECSAWRVVLASYLATNSATLTEFFAGANQGLGLKLIRFGRISFVFLFPGDCPNSLVAGGAMVVGTRAGARVAEAAGERAWVPAFTYLKLRVEGAGAVGRRITLLWECDVHCYAK